MCSGPTIAPKLSDYSPPGQKINAMANESKVKNRNRVGIEVQKAYQEELIRRQTLIDSKATGPLKGLALPEVDPTGVPDLKNLVGTLIKRRQ